MKYLKKGLVVFMILSFFILGSGIVFALPPEIGFTDPDTTSGLGNIASRVLGFIQFIGYGIAVGMLLYIGIKYMMSSAADKADLKKGSINYVVGAILVAGATAIVSMLITFGNGIGGSTTSGNTDAATRARERTAKKADDIYIEGLEQAERDYNAVHTTSTDNSKKVNLQDSALIQQMQADAAAKAKKDMENSAKQDR